VSNPTAKSIQLVPWGCLPGPRRGFAAAKIPRTCPDISKVVDQSFIDDRIVGRAAAAMKIFRRVNDFIGFTIRSPLACSNRPTAGFIALRSALLKDNH
jgi:hypothetical protein